jgi:hypothetical protein
LMLVGSPLHYIKRQRTKASFRRYFCPRLPPFELISSDTLVPPNPSLSRGPSAHWGARGWGAPLREAVGSLRSFLPCLTLSRNLGSEQIIEY